jgi:hypothetical protein
LIIRPPFFRGLCGTAGHESTLADNQIIVLTWSLAKNRQDGQNEYE